MTVPAVVPTLSEILYSVVTLSLLGAQVYRYRRASTPVERQQTKWVLFGFSLVALIAIGLTIPESLLSQSGQPYSPYMVVGILAGSSISIPIALCFGMAILRSHLYDIDVLINRTLVYGTLTASLAFVYFGLIFALQYLLRGLINQNNDVAIVVSTLAIFALFQPLHRRIQSVIDRRFYRRKYDVAKIIEAFSATLRQEVDLDLLQEQLLAVVIETMQPTHVSLWLHKSEPSRERNTRLLPRIDEEERVPS